MPLSEIDRNLLERCLKRKPRAWEDFVDRFLGLVVHVVNYTAQARGMRVTPEDRDDLCAEVFLGLIEDDFKLLRGFCGRCSLAVYLVVVAHRIVNAKIMPKKIPAFRDKDATQRSGRSVVNGRLNRRLGQQSVGARLSVRT